MHTQSPQELLETIKKSAANIEAFHAMQKREGFERYRRRCNRVADTAHAPRGRLCSRRKGGLPFKRADEYNTRQNRGRGEIIMVTPPGKTGEIEPLTLVAADIAGAEKYSRSAARRQ